MTNDEASTPDLGPFILTAARTIGVGPTARALDLSREATLAVVLGLGSKGSVAIARANLAKLAALMGAVA